MDTKATAIVLITCFVGLVQFCSGKAYSQADQNAKNTLLHVYLPRAVTIEDAQLRLGQVSIIRGKDRLVAKAGAIPMGRISIPGQEIVVDRSIILSRLACNGIPASKVILSGAEKTTVKQQQQTITGAQLVEVAKSFLKKNLSTDSAFQARPVRIPKDVILPGTSKNITWRTDLIDTGSASQAKVRIVVTVDSEQAAVREVTLALKYPGHRVVTLSEIPAGAVISPENVKVEETLSDNPEPANWRPPYGLAARRRLVANTAVSPSMVGPLQSAVAVQRNETVVIQIERPGFSVTALGVALQKGRAGDYIKVRNVDSQRIILCEVNEGGNVKPIL